MVTTSATETSGAASGMLPPSAVVAPSMILGDAPHDVGEFKLPIARSAVGEPVARDVGDFKLPIAHPAVDERGAHDVGEFTWHLWLRDVDAPIAHSAVGELELPAGPRSGEAW